MKSLIVSILFLSMANTAVAATPILGWTSTELSQEDASRAVLSGVRSFVEEENSCELEEVWGLEAVNNLRDMFGNPVIVVLSTAQADGVRCNLEKYQDCSTSFYKQNGQWKYESTSCETEEVRH